MPDLKNHFIEPGLKKKIWRSLTLARKYQYLCGNIHQYGILETTIILSWFTAVIKLMIGLPWSLKWKMFMENSYLYSDKKTPTFCLDACAVEFFQCLNWVSFCLLHVALQSSMENLIYRRHNKKYPRRNMGKKNLITCFLKKILKYILNRFDAGLL